MASTPSAESSSRRRAASTRTLLHVLRRRQPDLAQEHAREVARAHRDPLRQRRDRAVGVGMVDDPGLQLAQRLAIRRLGCELGAELRLAAGAAEEEHHLPRGVERDLAAEVVLHQRERQVHARGDAGGGPDVAVADEDRIGIDPHPRVALRQAVAPHPVGRRAPAVEQPRLGEQEAARADRSEPPHARRETADAADQRPIVERRARAQPAGHQQGVDTAAHRAERAPRDDGDPGLGVDRARHRRHDLGGVRRRLGRARGRPAPRRWRRPRAVR